ncbi:hypothetical protein BGZ97_003652 [Linnemannia gamsii]|uniref:F-box domain-containing protein n=1 Tax=Linnemannia gamsii TaxID=64522 RepID=A0A9P6QWU7_9FUNG|nr:hypothetical protein BGZ97_003652 [Linnemannia gamsii]
MAPRASTRFFEMPELVAHLIQYLDLPGISHLMQTCRHQNALCTPALYYNVKAAYARNKNNNLFGSKESTQALARNVQHVRQVHLQLFDVVYYVNCNFAYQDQLAASADSTVGSPELTTRPLWLAPPAPHMYIVMPVPPMTHLTMLEVGLNLSSSTDCPYFLPTYRDPRATLTYVCWILDCNPHLIHLRLRHLVVKDHRDIRLLSKSIFGLKKLQTLNLGFDQWFKTESLELVSAIFFSCPPSLQSLEYLSVEQYIHWSDLVETEYLETEPGKLQPWEKNEKECGLPAMPRRQEPLAMLKELVLWEFEQPGLLEDNIRSFLAQCPNLLNLSVSAVTWIENVPNLAQEIVRSCPKLVNLTSKTQFRDEETQELMLRILGALPEQQVQSFCCSTDPPSKTTRLSGTQSLLWKQSSTLRSLTLDGCKNIDYKAVQVALIECKALEHLEVNWAAQSNPQQLCIDLESAVESPWACTRLHTLVLTVVIPDRPFHHFADGELPYYKRRPPTILTAAETEQFAQLEVLYQQLGKLTNLRHLNLKALFCDPEGLRLMSPYYRQNSFPGMLNLRNAATGRPGYLHLLGGLTKLRRLMGSVAVVTKETEVTVGMDEVQWMEKHWPALETSQFGGREYALPKVFQWFQEQRQRKGQQVDHCALGF